MTIYFFESSALVKNYVLEVGTSWMQNLIVPSVGNVIYISRVTTVEVVSAISRRSRSGGITPSDAAVAIAQFKIDAGKDYRIVELSPASASRAQILTENHFLRGYDALQLSSALFVRDQLLAIGSSAQFLLVSANNDLNVAAQIEGLSIENPNNHP